MTTPADNLRAAVRAIYALKSPPPPGSQHYQAGWDTGLEAAIEAVKGVFEQPAAAVARQVLGTPTTAPAPNDRLRKAAQRALESLNDLIADTTDPGVEALGARHELGQALLNTSLAAPSAPAAPAGRAADLAAGIRAAADEIAGIDFHPKARARSLDIATGLVHRLRRLADEAQPTETEARDCPACDAGIEHTEHCPTPETHNAGCGCPSDVAAAYASCPGYEMTPSPCRCPCYGCKHHCSAHQPATAATEEPQP